MRSWIGRQMEWCGIFARVALDRFGCFLDGGHVDSDGIYPSATCLRCDKRFR